MTRTFCDLCKVEITEENATRHIHHSNMGFVVNGVKFRIECLDQIKPPPTDLCRECVAKQVANVVANPEFWLPSV